MSFRVRILFLGLLCALAATFAFWEDDLRFSHVAELSVQGNPPPAIDPHSITGYANNQRYFLGSSWRSQTFHWITQTENRSIATDLGARKQVEPAKNSAATRAESSWYPDLLRAIARSGNFFWKVPLGLAVEKTALIEPLLLQVLLLALPSIGIAMSFGTEAVLSFVALALSATPIFQQFLPGVLEPEGTAMFLGFSSIVFFAAGIRTSANTKRRRIFGTLSVLGIGLTTWLSPAVGLPALFAIGLAYGAGLLLWGNRDSSRGLGGIVLTFTVIVGSSSLILPFTRGFGAWMTASETIAQVTALDPGPSINLFAWSAAHSWLAVTALVAAPLCAIGLAAWLALSDATRREPWSISFAALLVIVVFIFGVFRIRWLVVAEMLALWTLGLALAEAKTHTRLAYRIVLYSVVGAIGLILTADRISVLRSLHSQSIEWSDVEAMVDRDLAQWLVKHAPREKVGVLAPPEMTDALVYFGNLDGLITTDREGRSNAVTASRILSAVLLDEAESLLRKRGINYIIVPSWDKVLSHLVRTPEEKRKYALLPRLEHWAPPRILRPIPYHVPPAEGMEGQTIAVYQVVDPQDEGLALSRLAEYFAEMGNVYLAKAAAGVLGTSFPGDPNAMIARAIVFQAVGAKAAFEREVHAVAAIDTDDNEDLDWDRRVQRAIVLALGDRRDEAKKAATRCFATMSESLLYSLTPLQLYRLNVMAKAYGLSYPTPQLDSLAEKLSDPVIESRRPMDPGPGSTD